MLSDVNLLPSVANPSVVIHLFPGTPYCPRGADCHRPVAGPQPGGGNPEMLTTSDPPETNPNIKPPLSTRSFLSLLCYKCFHIRFQQQLEDEGEAGVSHLLSFSCQHIWFSLLFTMISLCFFGNFSSRNLDFSGCTTFCRHSGWFWQKSIIDIRAGAGEAGVSHLEATCSSCSAATTFSFVQTLS